MDNTLVWFFPKQSLSRLSICLALWLTKQENCHPLLCELIQWKVVKMLYSCLFIDSRVLCIPLENLKIDILPLSNIPLWNKGILHNQTCFIFLVLSNFWFSNQLNFLVCKIFLKKFPSKIYLSYEVKILGMISIALLPQIFWHLWIPMQKVCKKLQKIYQCRSYGAEMQNYFFKCTKSKWLKKGDTKIIGRS